MSIYYLPELISNLRPYTERRNLWSGVLRLPGIGFEAYFLLELSCVDFAIFFLKTTRGEKEKENSQRPDSCSLDTTLKLEFML